MGAPPNSDGRPDADGAKFPLSIGVRPDIDAGEMFVLLLGEGGSGRPSSRCRKFADGLISCSISIMQRKMP